MAHLTIGEIFRRNRRAVPDGVAASMHGAVLTFADLDRRADRIARVLAGLGVGHRDRVVWWGDTCLEAVPLFAGLARLGAVFAPVNARLNAAEAAPVIARARPRLVVVDDAHADGAGTGTVRLAELDERAARLPDDVPFPDVAVDERDPHVIFFTSGSTGAPKGVVLSHRANFLRSFPGIAPVTPGPTVCMFPMFHMAAWSIALGCWQAGNEIAFVGTADAVTLLDAAQDRRAARLYAIPAVWHRLLEALDGYDLSTLREADTGTSATPPELIEAIRAALPHTQTRVMYGSTEAGPATMLSHHELRSHPGSVGRPTPGVELRLADQEVWVRSPFLMDGYFEDPVATAAAVTPDGWYRTGDLGSFQEDGVLSIVGRLRDVIRTGGETVAPTEVESAVVTHPAVAEVAVVGFPDPSWGEIVCAVVVLHRGSTLSVEELRVHCDSRLAPFKHPRRVVAVDALPRTAATGQVQRTLIVERLLGAGP